MVGKFQKHKFAQITNAGIAQCMIRMGEAIRVMHEKGEE